MKNNLFYNYLLMMTLIYAFGGASVSAQEKSGFEQSSSHTKPQPRAGKNTLVDKLQIKPHAKKVVGDQSYVTFNVEVDEEGEYYISFWLCPVRLKDGSFAKYQVSVNGDENMDEIIPREKDWQSISFSQERRVALRKGGNTISIIGRVPIVPNVQYLKIARNPEDAVIDNTAYQNYRQSIENECKNNINRPLRTLEDSLRNIVGRSALPSNSSESPLYNFEHRIHIDVRYTFYGVFNFTRGEQVNIKSTGKYGKRHVLEFFSEHYPENFSLSNMSFWGVDSLSAIIPETGTYYIKVRSYDNATAGFCDININNRLFYDEVPIFSRGVRCSQDTTKIYNTFTCNNGNTDPILWIEEGYAPGKIHTYNDDFAESDVYDWGLNSRITRQYQRPVDAVLLSNFDSSNPDGHCDLYIKCENSTWYNQNSYLEEIDAIQSSPASAVYNCFSWSGGITSYWEYPYDRLSMYYADDELEAFDNFYNSKGLTRVGATEQNSVLDLYGAYNYDGNEYYTHATVKKGVNEFAHGYSWESKPGNLVRTFHPRYSLNSYGSALKYYIRDTLSSNSFHSLEEEIAENVTELEYVDFEQSELSFLTSKISSIKDDCMCEFNRLYSLWHDVFEKTTYSSLKQIADCQEYRELLEFCKSEEILMYAVFEKLSGGDVAAIPLVEDLTFSPSTLLIVDQIKKEFEENKEQAEKNRIRPLLSNAIAYVKKLLALEYQNEKDIPERKVGDITGISYSNSNDIHIEVSNSNLNINFELPDLSKVSLDIIDVSGNTLCVVQKDALLEAGSHSYNVASNQRKMYLVRIIINGHVNVKKVFL